MVLMCMHNYPNLNFLINNLIQTCYLWQKKKNRFYETDWESRNKSFQLPDSVTSSFILFLADRQLVNNFDNWKTWHTIVNQVKNPFFTDQKHNEKRLWGSSYLVQSELHIWLRILECEMEPELNPGPTSQDVCTTGSILKAMENLHPSMSITLTWKAWYN